MNPIQNMGSGSGAGAGSRAERRDRDMDLGREIMIKSGFKTAKMCFKTASKYKMPPKWSQNASQMLPICNFVAARHLNHFANNL